MKKSKTSSENSFKQKSLSNIDDQILTTISDKKASSQFFNDGRTFFCSELVAKSFKILKIIQDRGESSALYLPKHFSSKSKKLILTPGTTIDLDQEIIIEQFWINRVTYQKKCSIFYIRNQNNPDGEIIRFYL